MRRPVSTLGPIALDATLWDEPTTGIGLYTHCLADALQAQGVALSLMGARTSGDHPRGAQKRTAWTLGSLPRVLRQSPPPVYHALGNFNLPLRRVPGTAYVLTVLDLVPLDMPSTVSKPFHWQFRMWLARSLTLADRLVCISECTRDDLLRRFPQVEPRTVVVPIGVDHVNVPELDAAGEDFLRALSLPKDYVLYAGSLDVRKNVDLVLDAQERLAAQGRPFTLVLAGQSWFGSGKVETRIARLRSEGLDIRALGYQPSAIFYALMRRAALFVFPSRYEGFGLPPLEAMRLGTPTVVSTAGSLPEVCGDAAPAVDPDDAEGLAAVIDRLLGSPAERRALSEAGPRQAAKYTWARTAEGTRAAYDAALRHRR
ncbi:glycosyltransferase family 4 protein [Corallococcus sp. ZKHCc1 1396]|uniref:Glycosyltransferase family 4 protein n=1 Tax=Corallococcus soli TaxID=2710757 RepID=A0ABR9PKQ0_9BACT|nr:MULTISPECIES: glycosyltransferase family 1 protein [Corallococcus]MBE4748481.1 glycosyltransferase family 4 protein [Corallococcus soli]MCY1034731.1 glycosyltransferase family 1 protein [Corallococcus sp. BB11-1]